ncbi:hypothetical protein SUGI_0133460 [Cryptomeria japonica]|uniref:probable xyloglucan 6-xylosyltransferase 1 n=1 Tax=Cryptomeria japonica TaxID=3369 RepID=UPI002408E09B|nr:probable xyloglucan 6-xylosyltransferase 1 [Cryptomeria japonica]GLJ10704.1 hypothetical protein SUGI_0133460 [Cryptomeria japonica]
MGAWLLKPRMLSRNKMTFLLLCLIVSTLFYAFLNGHHIEADFVDQSPPNKPARVFNRAMQSFVTDHPELSKSGELNQNAEQSENGNENQSFNVVRTEEPNKETVSRLLHQVDQGSDDPNAVPFMLVTGERSSPCVTSHGSNVMMKTYKNKVDYCNLHGCKVWYALEIWQKGFVGTWVRYPLLLRLMKANPSVTWFMWMDSDAIFTDFNFSIPFERYNGWNKNMVVPGFWEKVYGENPDWIGLNAGVFLIRNCEWSHKFLEKWIEFGAPENIQTAKAALNTVLKSRPQEWDPDDQSVLVYLLNTNRKESEENVFLEASYSLHGYFEYIVDEFEDILVGKAKWPFVTHFCGCNFCGGKNTTDRCTKGFERAFNFADNQLLRLVGLRHSSLSSSSTLETVVG